jgi:hypothetical protein
MFGDIKRMASDAGRDADGLQMIVTANVEIHTEGLGPLPGV